MKALSPIAVLISALLLQGCVAAAVVGTAAVGTKAATDPQCRHPGRRWYPGSAREQRIVERRTN